MIAQKSIISQVITELKEAKLNLERNLFEVKRDIREREINKIPQKESDLERKEQILQQIERTDLLMSKLLKYSQFKVGSTVTENSSKRRATIIGIEVNKDEGIKWEIKYNQTKETIFSVPERFTEVMILGDDSIAEVEKEKDPVVKVSETKNDFLSVEEEALKRQLESKVDRGLGLSATALKELRDKRLYREHFSTFELYCEERFQLTQQHVYRLISFAEISEDIHKENSPNGLVPINERQARPLKKIEPENRQEAWNKAIEKAGGQLPSGRIVEETVATLIEPEEPVIKSFELDTPVQVWYDKHFEGLTEEERNYNYQYGRVTEVRDNSYIVTLIKGGKAKFLGRDLRQIEPIKIEITLSPEEFLSALEKYPSPYQMQLDAKAKILEPLDKPSLPVKEETKQLAPAKPKKLNGHVLLVDRDRITKNDRVTHKIIKNLSSEKVEFYNKARIDGDYVKLVCDRVGFAWVKLINPVLKTESGHSIEYQIIETVITEKNDYPQIHISESQFKNINKSFIELQLDSQERKQFENWSIENQIIELVGNDRKEKIKILNLPRPLPQGERMFLINCEVA